MSDRLNIVLPGAPFTNPQPLPAPTPPTGSQERVAGGEPVSRFEQAVSKAGLQSPEEYDLESLLRAAGVDVEDPNVQLFIRTLPDDIPPDLLQFYVAQLATKYPSAPVTVYGQAFEASGFTGPQIVMGVTTPSELRGVPESQTVAGGKGFSVHPETGWIMYANGVLVNPGDGSVYFDPTSAAPGSPNWLRQVQTTWTEEQVMDWRKRLVEFGYLTKEQGKVKGIDQAFLDAIQAYHVNRYRNFGTSVPTDLAAIGQIGGQRFRLTAEDFQAQIRGDVREQFRRVFGNEPSEAELDEWSRFVTQQAIRLQKVFEQKGATPSTALSLAATEAEERLIEELETSPEASFLRESVEENTRLRDALATAVVTARSLAG